MRILYDPAPRTTAEIFTEDARKILWRDHEVIEVDEENRDALYQAHLPDADVLISQQPMDKTRLDSAPHLRAIFNVETNFLPNIDYESCFERGIHVLTPSSVFAIPVAEIGLGMALSLARGIHIGHGKFVEGEEEYGLSGNADAELLTGSQIGIVGFGDLGQALRQLLMPFQARILVHDPWLPEGLLLRQGVEPGALETVLKDCRLVFVTAAVTSKNQHLLDARRLSWMKDGAMLVLLSRAALADFDALKAEAAAGRLRIATDVFPQEPVSTSDPIRQTPNMLFSAHRAGALTNALQQIGTLVLEDLSLIAQGLPPVSCRRAQRETIGLMRSKPIEKS